MQRRGFLALTGVALCLPSIPSRAQAQARFRQIALIEAGAALANQHFVDAFMAGLREFGYVQGKNVVLNVRWAEGRAEGFRRALDELIQLRPEVIVISSSLGAVEAKKATSSIPVVFIGVPDPVGNGLVNSLARPGGNMTGLARSAGEGLLGKTVQTLKEIVPGITRMAILWNPDATIEQVRTQAVAVVEALGIAPLLIEVRDREGIAPAFAAMRKQRANSLFVITDPLTLQNRSEIVMLAATGRIPAVYEFGEFVRAGGLVAYSSRVTDQFRRAASFVDKILHGATPGDLPVEQPTRFELVINMKTAKALGLAIPQSVLLRADEVIQ